MEEEERVVKTQGFEIPGPRYHEGTIRLQPPREESQRFSNQPFSVFLPFHPSLHIHLFEKKKCGISHAEVFRIIAGITPFM